MRSGLRFIGEDYVTFLKKSPFFLTKAFLSNYFGVFNRPCFYFSDRRKFVTRVFMKERGLFIEKQLAFWGNPSEIVLFN